MSDLITRFEADLLDAAERLHRDQHQVPRWRRPRRAPLTIGALALLGATVAAILSLTAASIRVTPAAFAVTRNADGSVTLTLYEVIGVTGANRALARLGVRVRIPRTEPGCAQTAARVQARGGLLQMVEPSSVHEGLSGKVWIIHPAAIPTGDTLLIKAELANGDRPVGTFKARPIRAAGSTMGLYRDPAPTCERPGRFYR
jgi:hypothetical protein